MNPCANYLCQWKIHVNWKKSIWWSKTKIQLLKINFEIICKKKIFFSREFQSIFFTYYWSRNDHITIYIMYKCQHHSHLKSKFYFSCRWNNNKTHTNTHKFNWSDTLSKELRRERKKRMHWIFRDSKSDRVVSEKENVTVHHKICHKLVCKLLHAHST